MDVAEDDVSIKMRRRLTIQERQEVCKLMSDGVSKRQIARNMGVSPSVIFRLNKKVEETGSVQDRPKVGRPRQSHEPSEHWIKLDNPVRYQCKHCSKIFSYHSHVMSHLPTHTGERPFKCNHCDQAFATSNTLKRHLLSHTKVKDFMCDTCAKCFANCGSLKIHIRIHTGEKPYKCDFCDRRCVTRGNLNAHMRVHKEYRGIQKDYMMKHKEFTSIKKKDFKINSRSVNYVDMMLKTEDQLKKEDNALNDTNRDGLEQKGIM